jgi:hypothetical protein
MACPFFLPTEKLENGSWAHAARLPLGCGWNGQCMAPGHEGEVPQQEELRDFCNLGYAESCGRLPKERAWDSVRFGARTLSVGNGVGGCVQVRYVCERGHLPVENGTLEFVAAESRWREVHANGCVQRMAECFLESYTEKRKRPQVIAAAS